MHFQKDGNSKLDRGASTESVSVVLIERENKDSKTRCTKTRCTSSEQIKDRRLGKY